MSTEQENAPDWEDIQVGDFVKQTLERSRWISVSARLPEERICHVLVFNGDAPEYNKCVKEATWFGQTRNFKIEDKSSTYLGTITHWKHIDLPPDKQ